MTILLFRKFQDEEKVGLVKPLTSLTQKKSFQRFVMISRGQGSLITSIAKATPSSPVPCNNIPPAPLIEEGLLQSIDGSNVIGQGCFGSCTKMVYKNVFIVCSKRIESTIFSSNEI